MLKGYFQGGGDSWGLSEIMCVNTPGIQKVFARSAKAESESIRLEGFVQKLWCNYQDEGKDGPCKIRPASFCSFIASKFY